MSITLSQLAEIAKQANLKVHPEEDRYLWGHWTTEFFSHPGVDQKSLELHFFLDEDGEFLLIMSLPLYSLKDCPHKNQVLEALLSTMYLTKSVSYEYDPDDGEVRATIEMPIEDGTITPEQFRALCGLLVGTIDGSDSIIRHAMKTGKIDQSLEGKPLPDPEKQEINELLAKIGGVEGLKRIVGDSDRGK